MKSYFFKHNFDSIINYEVNLFPKFDFIISFLYLLKNLHFEDTWYCFGSDDIMSYYYFDYIKNYKNTNII